MLQDIDLRELAGMTGSGRDFVSVYFRGDEGLKTLKARERNLLAMLEDEPVEAEHFELSMKMVHDLLEQNPTQAEGICVFACAVVDFVRGHPLALPVPNEIYVGPSPYIRPLAELQDEYQTFALVACDNSSTRIYLVTNEQAELEERIQGGVKNHVRKGGWSQQRYSRRRDNQLQHYAREVAGVLDDLLRSHKLERVMLMGSAETMNEIERELPKPTAEMLIGKEAFDLHRSEEEMIDEAYKAYFAEEQGAEGRLWERIKNQYKRHGLAAVGATAVLEALQQGRVETAIVTRDADLSATQCRDCGTLVHGAPATCQKCGSTSVFPLDLVDEIAKQAKRTSAHVEFSDAIPGLTKVGHIAALLRY